jgi:hypothetical protein
MATQTTHPARGPEHAHAPAPTTVDRGGGIREHWRAYRAQRKQARLQSSRTRRALAAGLRRTADPIQPPRRFDPCPVLADRAAAVRDQLLELANALEQTTTPDPACVALIRELLTNGTSPLYNPNLPARDLQTTLTRARAGITAQPAA